MNRFRLIGIWVLGVLFISSAAWSSTTVTLSRKFIKDNKDRATIEGTLLIDYAHDKPKPASEDGDIHIAAWSPEVGLITVAEIMNSKLEKGAVKNANDAEGRTRAVPFTGVWRIWPEHGGDHVFAQDIGGDPVPPTPAKKTNPDHLFEIHPLTTFDGIDVADAIGDIPGYTYKHADDAFHRYENTRFHMKCGTSEVEMTMSMVGYNYTEFTLELNEDVQHTMQDGGKAFKARILDSEEHTLVSEERMILVPGTGAFEKLKDAKAGERYTVLGMPRLSFSLVEWRCANAKKKPYVLQWDIPYEMVLLEVF